MPGFGDTIVIFFLALMLLGPKKLPALARELGKWIGEFRRASNEFKMQMEEELRAHEQAEKDKKVETLTASAPPPTEPVPTPEPSYEVNPHLADTGDGFPDLPPAEPTAPEPLPEIASHGELTMRPPDTGLPISQSHADPAVDLENPATSHSEATHG